MVDLPKPERLKEYLLDIAHAITQIEDGYRWAYPDAHRRPKHASQELVSGGGERDTADLVAETERFRSNVRHAASQVVDARNRLMGAVVDLNAGLALLEPPPTIEVADVRVIPHPEDAGGVKRAREAQERRHVWAASSGDWSEVTG